MLETIIAHKRRELVDTQARVPWDEVRNSIPPEAVASFRDSLLGDGLNIIAEVKYHSPSRGDFPCPLSPIEVAQGYAENGAVAVSVLTDEHFFKGSPKYLKEIHQEFPQLPLLRKDFILEPYQVVEAAAWGASAYLLIAACLEDSQLAGLLSAGADYGIEPLLEVHDLWELERAVSLGCRTLGVNNRNLKTFQVDLRTSFDLARRLEGESGFLLVSESGISERRQIEELRDAGFAAFLIGSCLMEADNPGQRLASLLGKRGLEN